MERTLLYIRKRQIIRELKHLGIYSLLICGLIVFFIIYSYKIYQTLPEAFYITISFGLVCFSVQSVRKDKQFIFLHIEKPHFELFSEYFLLTFPFAATSLFTAHWYCFPILQIFLFLISFNKFTIRKKTYFKNISKIFSPVNFEWISGFRKSFINIIAVYILALGLSWVRIIPLFFLWLLTIIIITFFNECEPVNLLREENLSGTNYLKRKLKIYSKYLVIFYLPVLIINTIFNNNFWIINIFFFLTQISLVCFAICFKYGNYIPNKISSGNSAVINLVAIAGAIPVLLPVPFIIAVNYYFKAKKNLQVYLND